MTATEPMSIEEARTFIDRVPWRWVRHRPYALRNGEVADDPSGRPPDPHQYVILEWREVPKRRVRALPHPDPRGRLHGDQPGALPARSRDEEPVHRDRRLVLLVDLPAMLNRERAEDGKHVPVPE
jgi:hypothetical protein